MSSIIDRYISPGDFDIKNFLMQPKRSEKGGKGSYDLCDIGYRYPCLTCLNGEECKICGTDCACQLEEGCADCVKGKRYNTQVRPLKVMLHDIKITGGLRFSPDPKMFGSGGMQVCLGNLKDNPSYEDIFGDSSLFDDCKDGMLKNINRAALMAIRRICPTEYPKDGRGTYLAVDDIIGDKRTIKQHIIMPLPEAERTKEKKGVSEPSKYFNISYLQSKDLTGADTTRVLASVKAKINKMIDQKKKGVPSRELPVGTYTYTETSIAVENDKGEIVSEPLERYTMLKGKNFTADMLVCYPSITFTPKLSVKETIETLLVTDWTTLTKTNVFNSKEVMQRIVLNAEQKKRNRELLTIGKNGGDDAVGNADDGDETAPADSEPPTPSLMTPIAGATDIQAKFNRIREDKERAAAMLVAAQTIPSGFDAGAMQ
jgi:hypothetical protein